MEEIWKDCLGYEGFYQVSNLGRVKTLERVVKVEWGVDNYRTFPEKIMKPYALKNKYYKVMFKIKGAYRQFFVHRLVATAFVPNPENLPVVNHLDNNGLNNLPSNLEWTTILGNTRHAIAIGAINQSGENNKGAKYTAEFVLKIREMYNEDKMRICDIARELNIPTKYIDLIVHRHRWKHI